MYTPIEVTYLLCLEDTKKHGGHAKRPVSFYTDTGSSDESTVGVSLGLSYRSIKTSRSNWRNLLRGDCFSDISNKLTEKKKESLHLHLGLLDRVAAFWPCWAGCAPLQCRRRSFLWGDRNSAEYAWNLHTWMQDTHHSHVVSMAQREWWGGDGVNYLLLLFRFPAACRSGALLTHPIHSLVIWRRSSVRHTRTECR